MHIWYVSNVHIWCVWLFIAVIFNNIGVSSLKMAIKLKHVATY